MAMETKHTEAINEMTLYLGKFENVEAKMEKLMEQNLVLWEEITKAK
jgi:hypothetical protein